MVQHANEFVPTFVQTGFRAVLETITPELAQQYLAKNLNRPMRRTLWMRWKRVMLRGEWKLSPQGIIFDTQGNLIDGQHRLRAIVESGVTVQMMVTRNVPANLIDILDRGKVRSISDTLGLQGSNNPKTAAAALQWKWRYDEQKMRRIGERPETPEVEELFKSYPAIEESIAIIHTMIPRGLIPPALAVWLDFECCSIDNELGMAFFQAWARGADIAEDTTLFYLRTKLFKHLGGGFSNSFQMQVELAAYIVKGWNAYVTGKRLKVFTFGKTEPFPVFATPTLPK